MNYKSATVTQLYTIAYHEHCPPVDKALALCELETRKKQITGISQTRIRRKRN